MPGWGDRGQHEGGWCKVREGREEEGAREKLPDPKFRSGKFPPPA